MVGLVGPGSRRACQPVPRRLRDATLVGEGEPAVHLVEAHPRDVDGLVIGVVLDGELAAEGLEQVVVDELVHPLRRRREPVVDGAELDEHPSDDAGLLGDLAGGRLDERLAGLDVSLGEAPLDAAGPVAPRDDRDEGAAVLDVDDDAAGRALLDRGQTASPARGSGAVCALMPPP